MTNTQSKQKNKSLRKVVSLLDSLFVAAVLLLALIISVKVIISAIEKKQPVIFGYMISKVMSDSMESYGFSQGDIVITKRVNNPSELVVANKQEQKRGSIITFYAHSNSANRPVRAGEDMSDAIIVFHEIIGISVDGEYITKGSSNKTADSYSVPFESVLGVYKETGIITGFIVGAVSVLNQPVYRIAMLSVAGMLYYLRYNKHSFGVDRTGLLVAIGQ